MTLTCVFCVLHDIGEGGIVGKVVDPVTVVKAPGVRFPAVTALLLCIMVKISDCMKVKV